MHNAIPYLIFQSTCVCIKIMGVNSCVWSGWNLLVLFSDPLCPLLFSLSVLFPFFFVSVSAALGSCQLKQIAMSQTTRVLGRCQSGCRAQKLITVGYKVKTNHNNVLFSSATRTHLCPRLYRTLVVHLSVSTVWQSFRFPVPCCSNFWVKVCTFSKLYITTNSDSENSSFVAV